MKRGFTLIELLVVIAIVAILAAILFPVFAQAKEAAKGTRCVSNSHGIGLAALAYMGDHDDTYAMSRLPDPERGVALACGGDFAGSRFDWRHALMPYVRTPGVYECPTNARSWAESATRSGARTRGDEANPFYPEGERISIGYAYGGYFHETWFTCRNGGAPRPRTGTEIAEPANLLFLVESNLPAPDLGHWTLGRPDVDGLDAFHAHGARLISFTLADGHTKAMRLARTVAPRPMWTDEPADAAYLQTLFAGGAARNPRY